MAEQETKDAIQSTALAVVEQQQSIVGSALVGASGSAVLAESTDSQSQILEQIRDIQVKTLRGIGEIAKGIKDMFALDKLQDRRAREDATELAKEQGSPDVAMPGGGDISEGEADKKAGGIFAFLGGLPGAGLFKKMFAPIMAFFGKGGLLVKLFGKFGPLGALILGFTLVYKYSDEIAAALAPAIDQIKKIIVQLKPVMDFLMTVADFLIKEILEGLGAAFTGFFEGISRFINGFKLLFEGDILGGLNEILGGLLDTILNPIQAIIDTAARILEPITSAVSEFFTTLYNDIVTYVTNVVDSIGNWFVSLKDNVVQFFVDAYNNAKAQITADVNSMIGFVGSIFTTITDSISSAYTIVKDFVFGIPGKILSFVSDMFSPIVDFFSSIGSTIKNAVNGVIDSLPLPDFVKDKIKFDTEPTESQLAEATEEVKTGEKQQTVSAKSIVATIGENKEKIQAYAEARGLPFNLEQTMLMNRGLKEGKTPTMMFGNANYADMISLDNLEKLTNQIKTGEMLTAQQQMKEEKSLGFKMDDLPPVPGTESPKVIVNKGGDTNTAQVSNQNNNYSGKLDTGVDSYHDRHAFAFST